jgi:hypothetical protein
MAICFHHLSLEASAMVRGPKPIKGARVTTELIINPHIVAWPSNNRYASNNFCGDDNSETVRGTKRPQRPALA